ncbi:hypothetical protein, partial [uncultured Parabacteroides sp.]|uniref:hypothetical protein n=1 Tax=uncultured Parabacteroides sp. TaxID=512312 RepID=UPI00280513B6
RSVCCLSEASFRRDSERRERSSEAGSALIFWLLLDQAKSNRQIVRETSFILSENRTEERQKQIQHNSYQQITAIASKYVS